MDIAAAKAAGVNGVVFGILLPDGTVDVARTRELIALARPLQVTFHRAFDVSASPMQAMEALIALGVERILTSGAEGNALEGLPLLVALVRAARGRIQILPGGGVTPGNCQRIVEATQVAEVHMALPKQVDSGMSYRNPRVYMGVALTAPEFALSTTCGDSVKGVVASLR